MSRFKLCRSLLVLGLCLMPSLSEAVCSNIATLTPSCPAGESATNVQTAITNSPDGAVITFANGSYNFNADINFANGKGTTLICASVRGCTLNGGNTLGMNGTCSGTNTQLYRISGFVFNTGATRIWFYGSANCLLTQFRIDNNTFQNQTPGQVIIYFGESGTVDNYFYGVIDHNINTNAQTVSWIQTIQGSNNTPTAGKMGGANNIFIEDNVINLTQMTDPNTGYIDGWGGHGVVVRFNTGTNTRALMHGTSGTWGPINFELYYNTFVVNNASDGYVEVGNRLIHHQGAGTYMIFENTFDAEAPQDGDPLVVLHSGSSLSAGQPRPDGTICTGSAPIDGNRPGGSGYPCYRQPGRDIDRTLKPMYVWRNRFSDTGIKTDLQCNGYSALDCSAHIIENRDYFNAVSTTTNTCTSPPGGGTCSPFNGTTGMGFGTLANRPNSCSTAGTQAADAGYGGVGYWATDGGRNWRTDNGSGNDGGLYTCTSTNTWTLAYTPYDYPHPLVSGGVDTTPPAAPTGVTISQVVE